MSRLSGSLPATPSSLGQKSRYGNPLLIGLIPLQKPMLLTNDQAVLFPLHTLPITRLLVWVLVLMKSFEVLEHLHYIHFLFSLTYRLGVLLGSHLLMLHFLWTYTLQLDIFRLYQLPLLILFISILVSIILIDLWLKISLSLESRYWSLATLWHGRV